MQSKQMAQKFNTDSLFQGVPTVKNWNSRNNNNSGTHEKVPMSAYEIQRQYTYNYSFFSYFYPYQADESLFTFINHVTNVKPKTSNTLFNLPSHTFDMAFINKWDRRLKMVEKKCNVIIKVGLLEPKLIKSLPRRKVTIYAKTPNKIPKALSFLEDTMPELIENSLFTESLDINSVNWPSLKNQFVVRNTKKSKYSRSINCPLKDASWNRKTLSGRIFPFSKSNKLCYNKGIPVYEADVIANKDVSLFDETSSLSNLHHQQANSNNSSKSLNSQKELVKYLKFPNNAECKMMLEYDKNGQPTNKVLMKYLDQTNCTIDNIKLRYDKNGSSYYYVKTKYTTEDQLVVLFGLLKYQIKY